MRSSALRSSALLSFFLISALACAGCSGDGSASADDSEDTGELRDGEASLTLRITIAASKQLFTTRTEAFTIGEGAQGLPCRSREFHLTSKDSLYKNGWSVEQAARFSENEPGADFREYPFAACRDAKTEILGWFGKERDIEFSVPEQLLDDDYKPTDLPLYLRRKEIGGRSADYFKCDSAFEKRQIGETETAKRYEMSMKCKAIREPSKGLRGPIEFISSPGPYAAKATYASWMLPPVTSTPESLEKVRTALFATVGDGKYAGVMSTLSKRCNIELKKTSDGLDLNHTIVSSNRTRRLELRAENLLGFVEGDVYSDPNRITEVTGKFAAAEFRDDKGGSLVVRFEKNEGAEAQIVRINGPEAYCRRLERQ
jgi:hypothetical protein